MTQNAHLTNHWVFSLQFFCNDVCLLQEHQNTQNHVIWCSGWSGVDIWLWKVGFMPWPIRHGLPDRALSSSGAVDSLQAGLLSNAKLQRAPSGIPCPGIMPRPYPFWASDNPLWNFSCLCPADELMMAVTSSPLSPQFFLDYLKTKYSSLYGL